MPNNEEFKSTPAYKKIKGFVERIMDYSYHNKLPYRADENMKIILGILNNTKVEKFGRCSDEGMRTFILNVKKKYKNEYLINSFGSLERLDYGTGHELNFLCYLYSLDVPIEEKMVGLLSYFDIIRIYIKKFSIEAAGSRGVWGLDDYTILPYLVGSISALNGDDLVWKCAYEYSYGNGEPSHIMSQILYTDPASRPEAIFNTWKEHVLDCSVVTQHFIFTEKLPYSEPNSNK